MHIFVSMPIIYDEQKQEQSFRHPKHEASPFFTYLIITCVKPADESSPGCTETNQHRDKTEFNWGARTSERFCIIWTDDTIIII